LCFCIPFLLLSSLTLDFNNIVHNEGIYAKHLQETLYQIHQYFKPYFKKVNIWFQITWIHPSAHVFISNGSNSHTMVSSSSTLMFSFSSIDVTILVTTHQPTLLKLVRRPRMLEIQNQRRKHRKWRGQEKLEYLLCFVIMSRYKRIFYVIFKWTITPFKCD
jgi:hypothetical protein